MVSQGYTLSALRLQEAWGFVLILLEMGRGYICKTTQEICIKYFHLGTSGNNSLPAQGVKNLLAIQEIRVLSLGREDPLEKEMAHPLQYSCLKNSTDRGAWLQYMGSQGGGHN